MNIKKIFLRPTSILVITVMVIGFFMTIFGQSKIGIPMLTFIPCVSLFICSVFSSIYINWKQAIIMLFGIAALIFVAYIIRLHPGSDKNHTVFWALESLVILVIGGLLYSHRNKQEKKEKD